MDCQACGACCATAADWPRFSLEDAAAIDRIPMAFVGRSGMRCVGDRCSALAGVVGQATACLAYAVRPIVCRDCEPGDDACRMARARWGLTIPA